MPEIRIYDGTLDQQWGHALGRSIRELSRYVPVRVVGAQPGSIDLQGYHIVQDAEFGAFHPLRERAHAGRLIEGVVNRRDVGVKAGVDTVILTEHDLYDDRTNFVFGLTTRLGTRNQPRKNGFLVLSTARLQTPALFEHVMTHELGHMYGAAPDGRPNTEDNLGSHCTNSCIMQQRLSLGEMVAHQRQISGREHKFCPQCRHDLSRSPYRE